MKISNMNLKLIPFYVCCSLNNRKYATSIHDFKLSPCFESCMYSFGYFPGVRLWFADVSEHSISSIFKG